MPTNPSSRFIKERRHTDPLYRLLDAMSFVVWLQLFFLLAAVQYAMPEGSVMLQELFHLQLRDSWDPVMLTIARLLSSVQVVECVVLSMLNRKRLRRANDHFRKSFIWTGFVALVTFAILVIYP